jgi:hypothetical protein
MEVYILSYLEIQSGQACPGKLHVSMRTGFSGELHVSHNSLEIVAVPFEAKKKSRFATKGQHYASYT